MGNIPAEYDYINAYTSRRNPSTVHASDTGLAWYFKRYLLQKAMSVFEWKLPEHWDRDFFLYTLYCWGNVAVLNTTKFGAIPQAATLSGYNVFYRPTKATITNPVLRGLKTLDIDKQCTIIKLQPDYGGILDIVEYYADMLALCSEGASINVMNSKLAYVFTADNKTIAESFKKMFDTVASGQPAVVIDKNMLNDDGTPAWSTFTQNLRENYIAGDILQDMKKWEQEFDTRIGIPNANTDKRERLITDEVNANNFETKSLCELWLDTLKIGIEKTNAMFDLDISVDWREGLKQSITEEVQDND